MRKKEAGEASSSSPGKRKRASGSNNEDAEDDDDVIKWSANDPFTVLDGNGDHLAMGYIVDGEPDNVWLENNEDIEESFRDPSLWVRARFTDTLKKKKKGDADNGSYIIPTGWIAEETDST